MSVGVDVDEVKKKQAIKADLDRKLVPFRILAAAWSGGVMLGTDAGENQPRCDDDAYAGLLKTVGETGFLPATIAEANLLAMIARGLGVAEDVELPQDREELIALTISGQNAAALPYDLVFTEVFHPTGLPHGPHGFDAVLGNPPWEGIDTSNREFYAAFDFGIFDVHTEESLQDLIRRLLAQPEIAAIRRRYDAGIARLKKAVSVHTAFVNLSAGGKSGATLDMYQWFAERATQLLVRGGCVGLVLPAALHANDGAAGIRRLYLEHMALRCCFSFENRRKLFEIDSRFKFATIVAQRGGPTSDFLCAFYLHDDQWLYSERREPPALTYSRQFVEVTTGKSLNFLELRQSADRESAEVAYRHRAASFGEWRLHHRLVMTEELHLSKNRWRLLPTDEQCASEVDPRQWQARATLREKGLIPLIEGKSIWQFTDLWAERPQYVVPLERLADKARRLSAVRFYRLAFRTIASSTNERSAVFVLLSPGLICSHSLLPEVQPESRPNAAPLLGQSIADSFVFDWLLRLAVAANITFNFLDAVPVPDLSSVEGICIRQSLRLSSNHAGYEALWREHLGATWREPGKTPFTWPALASDDERWAVRATIDAVVADAYGLSRGQYAHVLSTFSHKSYKKAPELCLAAFDELKAIGLEAFGKKHDPYWDIPLNENLPTPVIDLPIPEVSAGSYESGSPSPGRRGRKSKASAGDNGGLALWEQKDGQLTTEPPGPIFDGAAPSSARLPTAPPSPGALAGQVASVKGLLSIRKVITSADVQTHLTCDALTARAVLNQLVDSGAAVVEGKAKGTKYRLTSK